MKTYSQIVASKLDEKVRELTELSKKYSQLYNEFKTLLDSMPDKIYLLDSSLKIVWVNKRVEKAFNKKTDEIIGKHCYEFFHGRDIPCSICPVQKAFISGEIESMEKKNK